MKFFSFSPFKSHTEESVESIPEKTVRKKKEVSKPWGKKERYLIFLTLTSTTIASAFLALSARNWKLPGKSRITLPKISMEETYIIENPSKRNIDYSKVEFDFSSLTDPLSGVYAFYVINLIDKVSYGVNYDQNLQAASLIKLPVIAALYHEAEEGTLDLDDTYTLQNTDKISGSGTLSSKPAGTEISYRELAWLMGNASDNTAFNIVRKKIGDEQINGVIKNAGMLKTSLAKNQTTPKDIGRFFQNLWQGNIVADEYRDEIISSLTDTAYEDYLPSALPEGVRVAHKFGREIHVLNDAGIVMAERPFVLVLMSDGIVESEAESIFPRLSRLIYDFEVSK